MRYVKDQNTKKQTREVSVGLAKASSWSLFQNLNISSGI